MTVKLTGNFLATARCLIYQDGNAITWSFNPNTNQLTAAYTGAGSAGSHNPTATIGLTAVNGSATTWMTSDSAPALSQAIVPTWLGLHTFSAGLTVSGGTTTISGHTLVLSANATVGGTNTGDQVLPVGANPSASAGLAAVNGVAATFMRSDAAPPLSVSITPTWTGQHIFQSVNASILLSGQATNRQYIQYTSTGANAAVGIESSTGGAIFSGTSAYSMSLGTINSTDLYLGTNDTARVKIAAAGATTLLVAQSTGWGTPTGQTVVNNFAAGAGTSVLQMSEAIAQIITDLKAFGLYGA